jgi:hypothetical protein
MTSKQKNFITQKLIPFILRDKGRGFEMESWSLLDLHLQVKYLHPNLGKYIPTPVCGTACCIGGSIDFLNGNREPETCGNFRTVGRKIGLNSRQSQRLFSEDIEWPEPFAFRYQKAKTPLGQAKVAVALLRLVVKTEGKCLDE